MSIRTVIQKTASGGGGGGTALVAWGPQFGEPQELIVNVTTTQPSVELENTKNVGVQVTQPAIEIAYNDITIGVQATQPSLEIENITSVGVNISQPLLEVEGSNNIGVNVSLPSIEIFGDNSAGVHLSGVARGAPFFQTQAATGSTGSVTSIIVAKPSGTVAGDLMVAILGSAVTIVASGIPAGWTIIQGAATRLVSAYKIATASEPASYTFTNNGNDGMFGYIMRLTGTDPTTPLNASTRQAANAQDPVCLSITTTAANCFIIACCAQNQTLAQNYTAPAGYTQRIDIEGNGLAGAQAVAGSINTKVQAAAAATGNATIDSSQTLATQYDTHTIAIAPGDVVLAT